MEFHRAEVGQVTNQMVGKVDEASEDFYVGLLVDADCYWLARDRMETAIRIWIPCRVGFLF